MKLNDEQTFTFMLGQALSEVKGYFIPEAVRSGDLTMWTGLTRRGALHWPSHL